VRGDDAWLSPDYHRDSVHFTSLIYNPSVERLGTYHAAFQAVMLKYEGRPHWAKHHTVNAVNVRAMYPMWSQYAEVVQRLDPKHIFRNAFLEQLFE